MEFLVRIPLRHQHQYVKLSPPTFTFIRHFCPKWLSVIHTLMVVAAIRGADIRSSLEFSILLKDTSICKPEESNQRPSNNKTLALPLSHSCPAFFLCSREPLQTRDQPAAHSPHSNMTSLTWHVNGQHKMRWMQTNLRQPVRFASAPGAILQGEISPERLWAAAHCT